MTKYIFITGGVVSGLGKGITGSSIGVLLKNAGLKVFMQKFDPYLNYDPGTMSPYQHGEVFVTADGAETDLDLGHYERFIDTNLDINSSVTSGKIYHDTLSKERNGYFEGKTVQVVPHITNIIKEKIYKTEHLKNFDVVITEIGGTVGDIESQPFIEAIRQIRMEKGKENTMFVHVALLPYLRVSGEYKTKPIQHSVKEMLGLGIQPDIIVARTEGDIEKELRDKISLFSANINETNYKNLLKNAKGILVPGGFGHRGFEGKIFAAKFARENNIPYLGLCLGMQVACIEFARNVLKLKDANSSEFDEITKNDIITIIEGKNKENIGGTLRLGEYQTTIVKETLANKLYNSEIALERHRHSWSYLKKIKYDYIFELKKQHLKKGIIMGFFGNVLDVLGVGSYTPTIAYATQARIITNDKHIGGTLSVGYAIPIIVQALLFTTSIEVDPVTLLFLVFATVIGA
ncbi:hypothetical protein FQR65_LT19472 [Abscondita terminalis]|nr:hypothetical protein FQR65_LT19472 [Abscondita terminalis]